jgi:hypothetical protein
MRWIAAGSLISIIGPPCMVTTPLARITCPSNVSSASPASANRERSFTLIVKVTSVDENPSLGDADVTHATRDDGESVPMTRHCVRISRVANCITRFAPQAKAASHGTAFRIVETRIAGGVPGRRADAGAPLGKEAPGEGNRVEEKVRAQGAVTIGRPWRDERRLAAFKTFGKTQAGDVET